MIGAANVIYRGPSGPPPYTPVKGYVFGGTSATDGVTTANIFTYSSETAAASTTTNLTVGRSYLAGLSNKGTKGYSSGGQTGYTAGIVTTNITTFSTNNTVAATTANLSSGRDGLAGISQGTTKGYFGGGSTNEKWTAAAVTTDKVTFSTDVTAASTVSNLSLARHALCGVSADSTKGYFCGGASTSGARLATTDLLTFSTDITAASTVSNLAYARHSSAAFSDGVSVGFVCGGFESATSAHVSKIAFSTNVTAVSTTATLNTGVAGPAGFGSGGASGQKGYTCGGYNASYRKIIQRLTFSTETTATILGELTYAAGYFASFGDMGV